MTASIAPVPVKLASSGGARLVQQLLQPADESLVGAKAANLARVARSGLAVPEGFVLPTHALAQFVARHDLGRGIARGVAAVAAAPATSRGAVAAGHAERITGAFGNAGLPAGLRRQVMRAAAPLLRRGPLVVRSSAIGEDSASESYAGQLDSFLHIDNDAALERAIVLCWASCWSARALAYRSARNLLAAGMGVIVQRQVAAAAAGVMFTRASDGSIVVEFVSGLADRLVSGAADPVRLSLSRDAARWQTLGETPAGEAGAERIVTSAPIRAQLVDAAVRLELEFGCPQDVEWTIDGAGSLLVVQSRPITAQLTIAAPPAAPRMVRWSNANIAENFPDPVSPLLYSIARAGYASYFRNLARAFGFPAARIAGIDEALRNIVGTHGGRLYYNLTSIHTVLRSAPFGDRMVQAFNGFVGTTDEAGAAPGDRGRLREWRDLARIAVATAWQYRNLGARVARFERRIDDFAARTHPEALPDATTPQLRAWLAELMEIRCNRWTDAALADAAAMVCYAALHRVVDGAYAGQAGALHNTLLRANPNLVSSIPIHRLWELSRLVRRDPALHALLEHDTATVLREIRHDPRFAGFGARFEAYLEEWGFRCSSELMLTVPTYQEEPAPLIGMIRAYAAQGSEGPAEALTRNVAEREAEIAAAVRGLRGQRLPGTLLPASLALRVTLHLTQAAIAFRERARLKQALLYSRCRRIALAIGCRLAESAHLAEAGDVFQLTVDEILELATGTAMLPAATRQLVAVRRAAHADVTRASPPDAFDLAEGAYWTPGGPGEGDAADRTAMTGIGACGGRSTGPAAVLDDATQSGRLKGGEVLVTRQTDPGWAPAFFLIRGLVIERGGMLSHGAIVAREFGIPCVVGVRGAATRIPDGATVTVDGDRGQVDVVA